VNKIDDAPYDKIILDKDDKAEIRIYNGDEDTNTLNKKRIGIYLFVNDKYIASEWVECGKLVNNTLVNNPKITNKVKELKTNQAIDNMKLEWGHLNVNWDDLCE
jgi:hypothetical protein